MTTSHGGRRWAALRLKILERDGWRCQVRGPGCTLVADQVDHITPLANGGAKYDPTNLRAACTHCNASLGATLGNQRRTQGTTRSW
jgi:5-methylcytosine-specific restriction protein A